ncbi:hypothetical protein [Polaribacter gochangensis]|uniref:hypothetical protein n=1 Tax=Polaribacter gochangensis TaxID=3252903 RepID=UPI003904AB7F
MKKNIPFWNSTLWDFIAIEMIIPKRELKYLENKKSILNFTMQKRKTLIEIAMKKKVF